MRRILLALGALLIFGQAQAQQISQFPSAASFNDSDLFPATQGYTSPGTGVTRKVSGSLLRSWITGNMGTILDGQLGATRGSIAIRGATAWGGLAPGTAGYVLTSNGTGADPSYQAIPGGALSALSDVTLTSPTNGQALVYDTGTSKWVNQTVTASPGGSSGQLQINNAGAFGGIALGGDCTFSTPNLTCTKLNNVSPGAFYSGTDAANLTGNIAVARLPTGASTSSSTIPLNNDARLNVIEIPFSFSGATTIAASVPIVRVIGAANGVSISTNPTWYSWCDTLPTSAMTFTLKQRHSGSTTSIGNIVVGTSGSVTSSPSWSAVTLAQGDAIIVTSPSSSDATANGCGLVMVGARL